MANIYVRNGAATPTSPFSTWATASANLVGATTIATSSDTIWIADDHTETQGAVTFQCPTTPGLRILCCDTHTIAPPTGLSVTSSISSTGTITIHGYVYLMNYQCFRNWCIRHPTRICWWVAVWNNCRGLHILLWGYTFCSNTCIGWY